MRFSLVQATLVLLLAGVAFARRGNAQELLNQKITLQVENERMRVVLARIETVAKVNFMFQAKVLGDNPRLSLVATNKTLGDLLNELLAPRQLRYEVVGRQIILSRLSSDYPVPSQSNEAAAVVVVERALAGRVTDETGAGLPGATVLLKGTTVGTSTDANGDFSLRVSDQAAQVGTLVISSVGYIPQEIALGNRTRIDIALKAQVGNLNEVVVVGYGTQQKRDLTGAMSQVKSEDIKSLPVTGLDQAIQGRAAGVQVTQNNAEPGGSVSIRIRGVGTVNGSEPLVVVDGLPMSGSINSINPNDVESIEILKDASAAAIYGSRAANGVLLVTTKRGKAGQTKVDFDAYYGVQAPARKIAVLNGPEFATLANEAYKNSGERLNPLWANPASLPSYDWQDAIFQHSPAYSVNLMVSGGTDKSRTSVSANYYRQDGVIVNSKYDRYSFRVNNDFEVSRKFRVGSNLYVARDNGRYIPTNDFSAGVLQMAYQMQPTQPIYAPDGLQSPTVYGVDGYAHFPLTTDGLYYPRQLTNPIWVTSPAVQNDIRKLTRLFGTAFAEAEVIEGLRFRTSIGGDLSFNQNDNFYPQLSAPVFGANNNDIRVDQGRNENSSWNWINTLTYSRTFAIRHALTALVGTDALQGHFDALGANAKTFPNNDVTAISLAQTRIANGGKGEYSLFSYLGRLTYAYDGKYLLAINVRRDGSSNFGPGRRYGVFPSASVGWRLSQEKFLKNVVLVNDLKLRASWGQLGNNNIGQYRYLNTLSPEGIEYSLGTGAQAAAPGVTVRNLANPDIRWETTTQTDVGMDASLLGGSVNLTVDYFNRKTSDMLVNVPVPASLGAPGNSIARNAGSMINRGVEFALGYRQIKHTFHWSADANFSTLKNEVTSLGGGVPIVYDLSQGSNNASTRTEAGQPIAYFWGLQTDGIFQTEAEVAASAQKGEAVAGDRRFRDINGDGKITADDRTNLGSGLPKYLFGLTLKADYKGFDFSMLLQGQGGNKIANNTRRQLYDIRNFNGAGVQNVSRDMLDRWTGPGTSNTMPRIAYNNTPTNILFSSYYIEDGSFLRCRNVQIGYTLPARLSQKINASRVRIYLSAQNLFTVMSYSGFDPEIGSLGANVLTTGFDQGRYPVSRMFITGLTVGF